MAKPVKGREERLRAALQGSRRVEVCVAADSVATTAPHRVDGRLGKVVLNSGETVPVRYAVVEVDSLITSHSGLGYRRDPRYPMQAQPRDYSAEIELQVAVEARAADLDEWQLLTDSVLPVDGPPIIREDGVVLSGNGRTQSMRIALDRGLYDAVRTGLSRRAEWFGLDSGAIARISRPVLVRVLQEDVTGVDKLVRYGIEMNRAPGQGMSLSEQSMSLSRLVTQPVIEKLCTLIASLPDGYSVREFMRQRAEDIAVILSASGIVDARKRSEYFLPDGGLTEACKDLVETTLAGLTVTDIDVLRTASKSTKDRLVRVGVEFMRMRGAGAEWDLAASNNEAVQVVTRAEEKAAYLRTLRPLAGQRSESLVDRMLHPERYGNAIEDMGFIARDVDPIVEALARALERSPRDYASLIADYASRAVGEWESMFECLHPSEVFSETIGRGIVDIDTDAWLVELERHGEVGAQSFAGTM